MLGLLIRIAAAGPAVQVSPPIVELVAPALEHALTVHNGTAVGVILTPRVTELDTRDCAFAPTTTPQPRSAAGWTTTARAVWVAAGGTVSLTVVTRPPPDAAGGYGAMIVLEVAEAPRPTDREGPTWARIGVPVLVQLPGASPVLELHDVEVEPPGKSSAMRVAAVVRNPGEGWARVALDAVVHDADGAFRTRIAPGASTWVAPTAACRVWTAPSAWSEPGGFVVHARVDGTAPRPAAFVVPAD